MLALTLVACTTRTLPARERFNEGVAALDAAKYDVAAAAFVDARDQAGQDGELRFRSAFDLGITYARQAEADADDAEKAMTSLQQAIAWFRKAVEERTADSDARSNLEIALRRMQVLSDRLNTGKNGLEARLEALIKDERGLRDTVRKLMEAVQTDASGDPLAHAGEFEAAATDARVLLADAGTISDLASDELSSLEGKPEADRSDEEKVRIVQLGNLNVWIEQARSDLSDSRRSLHRVDGPAAHRRAEAALGDLKRARDQLLDPVKVLKAIGGDQMELIAHTQALVQVRGGGGLGKTPPPGQAAPDWLTGEHLGDRQGQQRDRVDEVLARFRAGLEAKAAAPVPAADPATGAPPAEDPAEAKALAAVRAAVPFLETATAAMQEAQTSLGGGDGALAKAADAEQRGLEALAQAVERFAELRQIIDLAFGEHGQVTALLTPPDEATAAAIKQLSTAERSRLLGEGTAKNVERVGRMAGMLDEEVAKIQAQAQQVIGQAQAAAQQAAAAAGTPDGGVPPAPPDPMQDPQVQEALQQLTGAMQKMQEAQALRGKAATALGTLAQRLAGHGDLIAPAKDALEQVTALRKLFFSVVEHLQELIAEQHETADDTATAQGTDDGARGPLLAPLATRQIEHAAMGQAIAAALAEQADAATQSGDPEAAAEGKKLADAAAEVAAANGDLAGARDELTQARDQAQTMSVSLEPAMESQSQAIEHLESALRILQPPQQQDQQQDQQDHQDQQDQQQGQQDQQQQQDEQQQRAGDRQSEAVREREAQRRKEQRERQREQSDPVEKDW